MTGLERATTQSMIHNENCSSTKRDEGRYFCSTADEIYRWIQYSAFDFVAKRHRTHFQGPH